MITYSATVVWLFAFFVFDFHSDEYTISGKYHNTTTILNNCMLGLSLAQCKCYGSQSQELEVSVAGIALLFMQDAWDHWILYFAQQFGLDCWASVFSDKEDLCSEAGDVGRWKWKPVCKSSPQSFLSEKDGNSNLSHMHTKWLIKDCRRSTQPMFCNLEMIQLWLDFLIGEASYVIKVHKAAG